jgi:hypothetical protein
LRDENGPLKSAPIGAAVFDWTLQLLLVVTTRSIQSSAAAFVTSIDVTKIAASRPMVRILISPPLTVKAITLEEGGWSHIEYRAETG